MQKDIYKFSSLQYSNKKDEYSKKFSAYHQMPSHFRNETQIYNIYSNFHRLYKITK
jgi:hypothetical protein